LPGNPALSDADGTLVTAAGFLPIGFANPQSANMRPRHFLDRCDRAVHLVRGRNLHALHRRHAAAEHHGPFTTRSHAVYETRVYRILRSYDPVVR